MSNESPTESVARLPLWRNAYEEMKEGGVTYGSVYGAEFFTTHFKAPVDSLRFGAEMGALKRELENDGLSLTGRGGKGELWHVIAARDNRDKMRSYQAQAVDCLRRAVILGTNTDKAQLTDEEARLHDAALEKVAVRAALMGRRTATLTKMKELK